MMYRPDENYTDRRLVFELRDGPHVSPMHIDKQDGKWVQHDSRNPRLIQKEYGAKHDAERNRKKDVIVQLIHDEAAKGRVYTANQFADAFEGKKGLGGERTIRQRISVLATKGYVKFFRNADEFGFPPLPRNKFGYLCVEDMSIPCAPSDDDSAKNETDNLIPDDLIPVKPTHYKCPQTGVSLPVDDQNEWVYQEGHEYV